MYAGVSPNFEPFLSRTELSCSGIIHHCGAQSLCRGDGSNEDRMLMLGNAVDDGLAVKGSSDRDISGVYLSKKE
jgi:hypothetical protein